MIQARKFLGLPEGTAKRKLVRLIGDYEQDLKHGGGRKAEFLHFFSGIAPGMPETVVDPREFQAFLRAAGSIHALFAANRLRHLLMQELGMVSADWDSPSGASGEGGASPGPGAANYLGSLSDLEILGEGRWIYLDDLRSPYNVGAVFRSAAFFSIDGILLSPDTPAPGNGRLDRTSMGTSSRIPWGILSREILLSSFDSEGRQRAPAPGITILETGGLNLLEEGIRGGGLLVLGNEELGVHPAILELAGNWSVSSSDEGACRARIVSIPGSGSKASLNVSVAAGIALSCWKA